VSPRAQVIAVGPEVKQVKEGDLVVTFNGTMAGTIVIDGDKYLMLREEHIAGVLINPTHTKE
jgi:co-chaperonin GroES (HSP10)